MLEPELLPVPVEPEPEPVALGELPDAPLELGELLDEPLPDAPEDELPVLPDEEPLELGEALEPPAELPDLKCLSHSEREMLPSLLASTDEKLGCDELPLAPDVPPAPALDELPMLPLDEPLLCAEGEADEPLEDLLDESARASEETTNSAAAVVTVTVLSI